MQGKLSRFILILFVLAMSFYLLYPSILWYYYLPEEDKDLVNLSSKDLLEKKSLKNDLIVKIKNIIPRSSYRIRSVGGDYVFNVMPRFIRGEDYVFSLDHLNYICDKVFGLIDSSDLELQENKNSFTKYFKEIYVISNQMNRVKQLQGIRSRVVKLGLDLAGGTYLSLKVDKLSLLRNLKDVYRSKGLVDNNDFDDILSSGDVDFDNIDFDVDVIKSNLSKSSAGDEQINSILDREKENLFLDYSFRVKQELNNASDNVLAVIENRINKFGVSEVSLSKGLGDVIFVELPRLDQKDVDATVKTITEAGQLNFKIVDDSMMENIPNKYRVVSGEHAGSIASDNVFLNAFGQWKFHDSIEKELVDFGIIVSGEFDASGLYPIEESDEFGNLEIKGFLILKNKIMVDGKYLKHASISYNQNSRPEVMFELDNQGAEDFARTTRENLKKRLAIVLDGKIKSSPVIQSEIRSQGVITLGVNPQISEVKKLVAILKAGVLPAKLKLISEVSIGPKLGKDNISSGFNALFGGLLIVIFFMIFYYKLAGFYSVLSLMMNLLFLFSVLSAFHFTITLPGIAGIVLTIGMAVDANVIIFERIKEEIRLGGRINRIIVASSFSKAFSAIFDSNSTTILAAFILTQIGTGVIQGFGFTLMWGIICSMFTSLFVTRFFIDISVDLFKFKKIYV